MAGKRFKLKTGHVLIGAAIFMALMTALVFANLNKGDDKDKAEVVEVQTESVVIAKTALSAGSILGRSDLKLVEWPKEHYPEGLVFQEVKPLIGRTLKRDILPSEPIYKAKLAGDQSLGGLPVVIPKGMRGVTVSANVVSGVAGFVKPGTRVDVLATGQVDVSDKKVEVAHTVLQNVMVLAIDQEASDPALEKVKQESDDEKKKKRRSADKKKGKAQVAKSVTLALWPAQVERLFLAEELGTLRLSLRNEEDFDIKRLNGATDYRLYRQGEVQELAMEFGADDALEESEEPAGSTVELIQGTEKSQVSF